MTYCTEGPDRTGLPCPFGYGPKAPRVLPKLQLTLRTLALGVIRKPQEGLRGSILGSAFMDLPKGP